MAPLSIKLGAPLIMVAYGWHTVAQIWAAVLAVTAIVFFLVTKDDPEHAARRKTGVKHVSFIILARTS